MEPTYSLEPEERIKWNPTYSLEPEEMIKWNPTHSLEPEKRIKWNPTYSLEPEEMIKWNPTHSLEPEERIKWNPTHSLEPGEDKVEPFQKQAIVKTSGVALIIVIIFISAKVGLRLLRGGRRGKLCREESISL